MNRSQASGVLGALLYYPLLGIPPFNPGSLSKDWMARLAKVGAFGMFLKDRFSSFQIISFL